MRRAAPVRDREAARWRCRRTSACSATTSGSSRCRARRPASCGATRSSGARTHVSGRHRRRRRAPLSGDDRAWLADRTTRRAMAVVAGEPAAPASSPDANLELDLGLDSMERVELLTELEQRSGAQVPAEARSDDLHRAPARRGRARRAARPARRRPAMPTQPWTRCCSTSRRTRRSTRTCAGRSSCARRLRSSSCCGAARGRPGADGPVASPDATICRRSGRSSSARITSAISIGPARRRVLPFRTFRRIFFVGAAEYFETPFMRWVARAVNIVPVDPDANLVQRDAGRRLRPARTARC